MTQRKRTDNDKVMDAFHELYPPSAPWNQTIWRKELGILKRTLFAQNYSCEEVIDAIRYCKLKGKNVYSLAYIPYVIESSNQYWTQLREREAERLTMLESQDTPIQLDVARKANAPGWLNVADDIEEVD